VAQEQKKSSQGQHEIKSAVQAQGYYLRNLRATKEHMIEVE
jgi:hypothetical protein